METAFGVPVIAQVAFWICAIAALVSALTMVLMRNLFHSAIALAGCFSAVAGIYFILSAEFIGVVQILVYLGALLIIVALALMFIKDVSNSNRFMSKRYLTTAGITTTLLLSGLLISLTVTSWTRIDDLTSSDAIAGIAGRYDVVGTGEEAVVVANASTGTERGVLLETTGTIGSLLFSDYLLALEIAGVLIVAGLISGIVIMRVSLEREDVAERGGG